MYNFKMKIIESLRIKYPDAIIEHTYLDTEPSISLETWKYLGITPPVAISVDEFIKKSEEILKSNKLVTIVIDSIPEAKEG